MDCRLPLTAAACLLLTPVVPAEPSAPTTPGPVELSESFFQAGLFPRAAAADARRWQLETRHPRSHVQMLEWSPDGEFLAVAELQGIVRIYEADRWRLVRLIYCPEGKAAAVRWSPDGKWLATSDGETTLRVWTSGGAPVSVSKSPFGVIGRIAWSADSQMIAAVDGYRQVVIRDRLGVVKYRLDGHRDTILGLDWQDRTVATASRDGQLRLWDLDAALPAQRFRRQPRPAGGQELIVPPQLFKHAQPLYLARWRPDEPQLATVDQKASIQLREAGHTIFSKTMPDPISDIRWRPDGERLAVSQHQGIALLEINQDGLSVKQTVKTSYPRQLSWRPDGRHLAFNSNDGLFVADFQGPPKKVFGGPPNNTLNRPVVWSGDGSSFTAPTRDAWLRIWNADGTPPRRAWRTAGQELWHVAWNPQDGQLATFTFGKGRGLEFWNAQGEPKQIGETAPGLPRWSPDGAALAVAGNGGRFDFFDARLKKLATVETTVPARHLSVWSPDSKRLAVVPAFGKFGAIELLQPHGKTVRLAHQAAQLSSLDWSPAAPQLASVDLHGFVRLWDAKAGGEGRQLFQFEEQGSAVAFSPDGQWLAAAGRHIQLFDSNGKPRASHNDVRALVSRLIWSPDSAWVGAQLHRFAIQLWRNDGERGPRLPGGNLSPDSASWSPNGRWIACSTQHRTIIVWDAKTGAASLVTIELEGGKSALVNAKGQLRSEHPEVFHQHYVIVEQQPDGACKLRDEVPKQQ